MVVVGGLDRGGAQHRAAAAEVTGTFDEVTHAQAGLDPLPSDPVEHGGERPDLGVDVPIVAKRLP